MADKKISELTEKTAPDNDDLLALVDSEADPIETKKIKASNITKIHSDLATGVHGAGAGTLMNTSSHLDNTAGGTDGETSKAPTSNVLYDHGVAATGVHGVGSDYICGAKSSGIKARDFVEGWTSGKFLKGAGAGVAPTEVAKTTFEWKGSDELDVSFLIPNKLFLWSHFFFLSQDGWTVYKTYTGSIPIGDNFVCDLRTGTTINSKASQYAPYWTDLSTWDRRFRIATGAMRQSDGNYEAWIGFLSSGTAPATTHNHYAFRIVNNEIFASCGNGTYGTQTTTGLSISTVTKNLLIKPFSDKIEYYVNGTLCVTLTTNLPTGGQKYFTIYITNTAAANTRLLVSPVDIWVNTD